MWYFSWVLGLGFACTFAVLNAMWLEIGLPDPGEQDREMLDHFGFVVRDLAASRRFYEAALTPLGLVVVESHPNAFIMARGPQERIPFVYIGVGRPSFWKPDSAPGISPAHYGFAAASREAVDAFYAAGLAHGGRDNGAPGARRKDYYGAYLLDPDNNNVEAGWRG